MKTKASVWQFLSVVICLCASTLSAQTWDIRTDWSNSNNPNGPWSLRFGNGSVLPGSSISGGWSVPQPVWGSIPGGWFKSNGAETVPHDWLQGDIITHTEDSGDPNLSMVIRWQSPINGVVKVTGDLWWGGVPDQFFRANDWAVDVNGAFVTGGVGTVGSGSGRGRGNPILFSEGTGSPGALSLLTVHVGDEIDLVVSRNIGSFGGNGAYTGENFTITSIPEPVSIMLLSMGGTLLLLRRGMRQKQ